MNKPDAKTLLAAAVALRDSLTDALRLDGIRSEHRSLTSGQLEDLDRAVRTFNNAADEIGKLDPTSPFRVPHLDADEITADVAHKAAGIVRGLIQMYDGQRLADEVRARIGDQSNGDETRPVDSIRDMIESREKIHDFSYPETATIRTLPWADPQTRAISDFANGTALYTADFSSKVAMYARTVSPWLGIADVRNSDNGRPLVVPKLTADVTTYTPGEGTAITPSDPTLASVTITPTGFKALTYISTEAFEDAEYNLSDILARSHARAIGIAFGTAFTTTVLAGISNGGTATGLGGGSTATFIGYEDLLTLEYGRAAPYRASASWVMANGLIVKARKWHDLNGQYLWPAGGISAGQPASFDGRSVYEDPGLATPASATKSAVYGDAFAGLVIKASPIRVDVSSDFLFDKDQIAVKTVQRIDGAVVDPAALAYLVSANS